MITNHGVHQWEVIPGLPDTGGQNVFVNQFSAALAEMGFRITIVNRGIKIFRPKAVSREKKVCTLQYGLIAHGGIMS